jgi:hypothetical protein
MKISPNRPNYSPRSLPDFPRPMKHYAFTIIEQWDLRMVWACLAMPSKISEHDYCILREVQRIASPDGKIAVTYQVRRTGMQRTPVNFNDVSPKLRNACGSRHNILVIATMPNTRRHFLYFQKDMKMDEKCLVTRKFEKQWRSSVMTYSKTDCAACGNKTKFQRCSQCMLVLYCSKTCQREHWKSGHKTECIRNDFTRKESFEIPDV